MALANLDVTDFCVRANIDRSKLSVKDKKRLLFLDIQDIVGDQKKWPVCVKVAFFSKELTHLQRIIIASFAFVNGLHVSFVSRLLYLVNVHRDYNEVRKVVALINSFESAPGKYKYYQYNVSAGRYEFISGKVKVYGKQAVDDRSHRDYYGFRVDSRYA